MSIGLIWRCESLPSVRPPHTLIHNCTLSAQGFDLTLISSNRTRSAGRVIGVFKSGSSK